MPQMSRNRKLSRAGLFAFMGIALVIAGGVAHAEDDEDEMPDVRFVRKMLRGIGLRNGQEAGIEYKERPPLVVPPSRDLPAPVSPDAMTVKSAAWPSDPDEKRRAAELAAKKKRDRKAFDAGLAGEDVLRPDQLDAPGKSKTASVKTSDPDKPKEMTPKELGFANSMWKGMLGLTKSFTGENDIESTTFTKEPSRSALTDPPTGYRTPSSAQPYGINTKQERPKLGPADPQSGDFGKY
jgi:hypothetical protein